MASLPSQHPHLALHLSDRALTPIISSSTSSLSSARSRPSSPPSRLPPAFSTSPPSSPGSTAPTSDDGSSSSSSSPGELDPQALQSLSLAHLTTTALASHDTAKRLGRGAPLRTMVEYAGSGPVVLHSYLCPMSLALGVPGRPRRGSEGSMTTAGGVAEAGEGHGPEQGGDWAARKGKQAAGADTAIEPEGHPPQIHLDLTEDEVVVEDGDGPNAPPMLITTVVAPGAEDIRDARRAAGRLERIARVFQTDWVAEGGDAT